MIRVVVSSSASERLAAARGFLDRFPAATEIMVVGASREAADDLVRGVTALRGATFGLGRASLLGLAVRVATAAMAKLGVPPATRLGTEAIAARVAFEAVTDRALPYFAPVARFPGFGRALALTLGELRLADVGSSGLENVGAAARDVGEILRRFEERLESGAVSDRAAVMKLATCAIADGTLAHLGRMPMVLLDVTIEQRVERAFVEALVATAPSALVTVPSGDDRTLAAMHELAARHGGAVSRALESEPDTDGGRGGSSGAPGETPAHGGTEASPDGDLARVKRHLFADAPPEGATHDEVVFFSAPGEGRESVEIARRILDEARAGTPFDAVAILLRAPEVYASLIEVALTRAGIPGYFARGTRRPDPSGRAFLALLDCVLEGLSAKKFAEYLSLGAVPPLDAAGAPPTDRTVWVAAEDDVLLPASVLLNEQARPPANASPSESGDGSPGPGDVPDADDRPVVEGTLRAPWRWEELLVESAVIGGLDRWRRRLAGLANEYRAKLEMARADEPESPRVLALERDLANLEHLRRFAVPLIERLAALPGSATWGEWLPALEALAPMVLRRPERVLAVLAELRPLDVIGPVPLAEVREVLADELRTLAERPPDSRYGRVFVGTVAEARGRSFAVVFVPGLAERMFPQKPREDPILLDGFRTAIDPHLDTQGDRSQGERLLLRLAVGVASRRLYLSYSRIDLGEARPRVPSFYALEVARALTGRVPDPQAMERDAAARGGARLAWPAPADPTSAVDEVEHDLATLGALLRGPASYGRARYLLELSPCLARSLRTRWMRWHEPRWRHWDGLVRASDGTRDALAAARLAARAYSASALQKFAACPYQFFLSAICRIGPREEIASIVEMDPMTRGAIFHRVQAELMRELQGDGRLPVRRESLDGARATLDGVLDRVTGEEHDRLAPAIQRVWLDQVEAMRADLRMWLERTIVAEGDWEPIHFELAFGLASTAEHDPRSVRDEVRLEGGFRFRGIVDLVERKSGATDLRVTDYKTGRAWWKASLVVGGGEMLQPVLYGSAVEQILGARVIESRLFYCTRIGNFDTRTVAMSDNAKSRGLAVLGVIDRAIERGFLPPAPRRNACGFCDFRMICGPFEEVRAARKDQAPLEDLRDLRDWP